MERLRRLLLFIIIAYTLAIRRGFFRDNREEDDMKQKSMGGNAHLLSDFTSRYTGLIHKTKAIVIGINQLRDNMTGYGVVEPLIPGDSSDMA